jgi:transposase
MGINEYLHRPYARSFRGKKVITKVSGKKYKNVGVVAAKMGNKIIEPLQYDGIMDSSLFEHWYEKRLLPALPENTVIVMDNASFHRKQRLLALTQKAEHRLIFLPPYSPELNPIEQFWSWLKNRLRKVLPKFSNFDDALSDCFQVG